MPLAKYREAADYKERDAAYKAKYYAKNKEREIQKALDRHKKRTPEQEKARYAQTKGSPGDKAKQFRKNHKRRANLQGSFVEVVEARVVFERDEGICGICGEPVSRDDFHVDHIIPLSKGGEHSYANVQIAHPHCNLVKHNLEAFTVPMNSGRTIL